MGCCASTPTNANHDPAARPLPNHVTTPQHDSSRAAISAPSNSASASASATPPHRAPSPSPSPARPNAPLRAPSPIPHSPASPSGVLFPWSAARLRAEREAFFDTRVTGSAEVWAALRLVSEFLRQGQLQAAQGVLDAVGLTCPSGRVATVGAGRSGRGRRAGLGAAGVYDERGVGYEVPGWVVRDPEDLLVDGGGEGEGGGRVGEKGEGGDFRAQQQREEADVVTVTTGSDSDGANEGEIISLKARLSDRSQDVVVRVGMRQTAAVVSAQVCRRIGAQRRLRLMYLGQVWDGDKTLAELGYKEGDVRIVVLETGKAKQGKGHCEKLTSMRLRKGCDYDCDYCAHTAFVKETKVLYR